MNINENKAYYADVIQVAETDFRDSKFNLDKKVERRPRSCFLPWIRQLSWIGELFIFVPAGEYSRERGRSFVWHQTTQTFSTPSARRQL